MTRLLLGVAILVTGMTVSRTAAGGSAQVSIRVSPMTAIAPTDLFVQVWIERDADNRWVRITVDSPDYFSSSTAELDGDRSPRIRAVTFRDVPAGAYELRSDVFSSRGRVKASARTSALVAGR